MGTNQISTTNRIKKSTFAFKNNYDQVIDTSKTLDYQSKSDFERIEINSSSLKLLNNKYHSFGIIRVLSLSNEEFDVLNCSNLL